ncbi:C6 zinc finger domain protein [Colletotrichum higginsianum IMI 349063]|uniref:C6 zinc finger domain protein n=3 Tax=Colletotrichum higginsianum TaxID=80884 RepID=A0A1B7XYD7_COLHI|nr:C6 zinc finger domain protein [Colletotrichum higginsianum IMI 349063]OBR04788.1 C6 zinc finger domain protein [Colletotrichum higginsianum IMI 349063]TIC93518.1 hypothetical protein CH35J_009215 [Colletotrichum higginsianum]GJC99434.1 C6 zinc finger domain protein [Colletotrichum higginsianum]
METVLRNACDACHKLKTKCPSEGAGACANCRRKGQICKYSPRSEMGRPRATAPEKSPAQKQQSGKRSASVQDASPRKRRQSSADSASGIPKAAPASPERGRLQQIDDVGTELMGQPVVGNGTTEPLGMSDYLSTLETSLCSFPFQSDSFIPDDSAFDISWPTAAPPPYSSHSPVPLAAIHDPAGQMAPINLFFEDSSDTSSSGNLSFQPDAEFGVATMNGMHGIGLAQEKQQGVVGSRESTPDDGSDALIEAYPQLASVLFGLHTYYDKCKATPDLPALMGSLEEVFPLVSSLCDILRGPQLNHLLNNRSNLTSPCFLLAGSVISTVVETYHLRMGPFEPSGAERDRTAELGTQYRLQLQTDATIMEFHLSELRPILNKIHVGFRESQTIELMDAMRRTLREFLENWRARNGGSAS